MNEPSDQMIAGASACPDKGQPLPQVYLHVGAHRTGTTTLQQYLERNQTRLETGGFAYWGAGVMRRGIGRALQYDPATIGEKGLNKARRAGQMIRQELRNLRTRGIGGLIVSEENIAGNMHANLDAAMLYPGFGERLGRYCDAFGQAIRRVGFSIRSYEAYWSSVLAYDVATRRVSPSKILLESLVAQPRRWRHLIAEIGAVFPRAEIVVWPFEAFTADPARQLGCLVGSKRPDGLRVGRILHNQSPRRGEIAEILKTGDVAEGDPKSRWQPFDATQLALLRHHYDQDLAWLRSGANGKAMFIESAA